MPIFLNTIFCMLFWSFVHVSYTISDTFIFFAYFHSYHKNRMYFIDVSQSVEHDHPNSLQFLRKVSFTVIMFAFAFF